MPTLSEPVERQVWATVGLARSILDDGLVAAWLYGSAVLGGLQPHSDLDLLVLADRSLTAAERQRLVDGLLEISSPPPWTNRFRPGERPLEITVVAASELAPWRFPPRMELQYGEWLRSGFEEGQPVPDGPVENPDLCLLLEQVRRDGRTIVGAPPRVALPPIPPADISRAILAGREELLAGIETDTTNVLLTLARMWLTLATGDMAPKDFAADWALTRISKGDRVVLERARAIYLDEGPGVDADWRGQLDRARQVAERLAGQVLRAAQEAGMPAGAI